MEKLVIRIPHSENSYQVTFLATLASLRPLRVKSGPFVSIIRLRVV